MKSILTVLSILFLAQANAQFDGTWLIRMDNNYNEEQKVLLKQNGENFSGKLKGNIGDKISGLYDESKNEISGLLRLNRKVYKFKGKFKNSRKKQMVIAKYCKCSGEPDRPLVLIKQKEHGYSDWRKAEETVRTQNSGAVITQQSGLNTSAIPKQSKTTEPADYSGRYRITITHLYTRTRDDGPAAVFDKNAEIYGTIGIRLKGKGNSGNVDIRPLQDKPNRVWSVPKTNPVFVQQYGDNFYKKLKDITGRKFEAYGRYEIDKSREFIISGELANDKLLLDIQMHLSDKDRYIDDVFGWKQRKLYIKDIKPNTEYLLESKIVNDGQVAIGFKLEKIK